MDRKLRVLDLFSGIGGFSLGLERTGGFETIAFCEYEEFPRRVLKKHWPDVPCFPDVRTLKGDDIEGPVDVICGGYPCQPFSTAGKRLGKEDDRHLWPEFARLVKELKPTWVIGENVAGHISMGLDDVLSDLESFGYTARPFIIPAVAVDAKHRRDRVWTVAYCSQLQRDGGGKDWESDKRQVSQSGKRSGSEFVADTDLPQCKGERLSGRIHQKNNTIRCGGKTLADTTSIGQSRQRKHGISSDCSQDCEGQTDQFIAISQPGKWSLEPDVGRVANGIPNRVDRLKALGNAVVPQIPEMIGRAILAAEKEHS